MGLFSNLGKKKALLLGVSLLLGAALIGGCGGGGKTAGGGDKGNILYIGMSNAPDSFNPLFAPGTAGNWTMRYIYATLLVQSEANKFEASLADSIDTTDNQNYTIKLNPKAVWSDGKPITADDVIYTLNTIANPKVETTKGARIYFLDGLSGVGKLPEGVATIPNLKKVDDHTVTFKTKTPMDPTLVKAFLGYEVFIIPKHVFESVAPEKIATSEFVTKPTVTSGPYKFVQYKTNDYVELAANENYLKGKPKIGKIFIRVMNGTNLVTELQSGGIQLAASGGIGNVPIKDVELLQKNDKLNVYTTPSFTVQYLLANNKIYNDKFRQAMTYAINRDRIVKDLFKGTAEVVPNIYSSASPYIDKNIQPLPYDPAKAKQLLAESGFDTSQELVLSVPIGNVLREQSADLIQQDLQAIGLNVKIQKFDFPTQLTKARTGDYQLALLGYGYAIDPDESSYYVPGGGSNFSQTDDPVLTQMFANASTLTSSDQRRVAYNEIQQYMQDKQYVTALYAPFYIMAQSKSLKGGFGNFWEGGLYDIQNWTLDGK